MKFGPHKYSLHSKYPNERTRIMAIVLECSDIRRRGEAKREAYYGAGSGRIWLDGFDCDGSEASLDQCGIYVWGANDCSHAEDAGVSCCEYILTLTPPGKLKINLEFVLPMNRW